MMGNLGPGEPQGMLGRPGREVEAMHAVSCSSTWTGRRASVRSTIATAWSAPPRTALMSSPPCPTSPLGRPSTSSRGNPVCGQGRPQTHLGTPEPPRGPQTHRGILRPP